jgi:spermidine synthase
MFFCERLGQELHQIFRIKEIVYSKQSRYQKIEILRSENFGMMLVLDGAIQTTERDDFLYHELLVHPVMQAHESPKNILIIGGGDGGALREVLKYDIERVDLVEIDAEVIEVAKKYLHRIHMGSFEDPRVEIHHEDGAKFVKKKEEEYDIIIIDGPDPIGPGKALYTREFYSSIRSSLKNNGFVVAQSESPINQKKEMEMVIEGMTRAFPNVRKYWGVTLSYPGFFWCYAVGSNGRDPSEIRNKSRVETKFYKKELHSILFDISFLEFLSFDKVI